MSIRVVHGPKFNRQFSMDYRERGYHGRGAFPTQFTSCIETERVRQLPE